MYARNIGEKLLQQAVSEISIMYFLALFASSKDNIMQISAEHGFMQISGVKIPLNVNSLVMASLLLKQNIHGLVQGKMQSSSVYKLLGLWEVKWE